jgi:hypothetical protein
MAQRPTLPSEHEFHQVLGATLRESVPEDGYWCYEATDPSGVRLVISFNLHEASVQIVLSAGGREIQRTSSEGLRTVEIDQDPTTRKLVSHCATRDSRTRIEISFSEGLSVSWGMLFDQ